MPATDRQFRTAAVAAGCHRNTGCRVRNVCFLSTKRSLSSARVAAVVSVRCHFCGIGKWAACSGGHSRLVSVLAIHFQRRAVPVAGSGRSQTNGIESAIATTRHCRGLCSLLDGRILPRCRGMDSTRPDGTQHAALVVGNCRRFRRGSTESRLEGEQRSRNASARETELGMDRRTLAGAGTDCFFCRSDFPRGNAEQCPRHLSAICHREYCDVAGDDGSLSLVARCDSDSGYDRPACAVCNQPGHHRRRALHRQPIDQSTIRLTGFESDHDVVRGNCGQIATGMD